MQSNNLTKQLGQINIPLDDKATQQAQMEWMVYHNKRLQGVNEIIKKQNELFPMEEVNSLKGKEKRNALKARRQYYSNNVIALDKELQGG